VIGSSLMTWRVMDNGRLPALEQASALQEAALAAGLDAPEMLAVNLLSAQVRSEVISSLVIVRMARAGIEEALQQQPNNVQLYELLQFTYEQEADLLDNATRVTIESSKRPMT